MTCLGFICSANLGYFSITYSRKHKRRCPPWVCVRPFWSLESDIMAVTILVYWSQRWLYLNRKVELMRLFWLGARTWGDLSLVNHKVATPSSLPRFIIYLTLNGTIIYKMKITLYWRRLETTDWDHEHIRTLLTDGINQVRNTFFAHIQSDFPLKPVELPPCWILEKLQLQDFSYRCRNDIHILYSKWLFHFIKKTWSVGGAESLT